MLVKSDRESELYLIDFGLATKYRSIGMHFRHRTLDANVGNPVFASLNAHRRFAVSRRDDLESMLYIMIYLYKGNLP